MIKLTGFKGVIHIDPQYVAAISEETNFLDGTLVTSVYVTNVKNPFVVKESIDDVLKMI